MSKFTNDNLMDCSRVYLKNVEGKGASTFARVAIKEGEMVEFGIMRRLPKSFNGIIIIINFTIKIKIIIV